MGQFEWISTALPRRIVAVRARTVDALRLPALAAPFGVLVLSLDPSVSAASVDRIARALDDAGASPVRGVGGSGADLWQEGFLGAVPELRSAAAAIDFYFAGSVLGLGVDVTDFAVLCLDGGDADWREALLCLRRVVSSTVDDRLHAAADAGREAEVRQAIEAGWPIDDFDDDLAETPLHKAARKGHLGIVRLLLAAGADVNRHCEDRIGETPLGLVAGECSLELARCLVDAGADPTIRGWMGITALDRAAARTDAEGEAVLALLRSRSRPGG